MKTRPHASGFAVLLLRLSFAALAASISAQAQPPPTLHPTLHHTVIVGYQGWHRASGQQFTRQAPNGTLSSSNSTGDGSGQGWFHYTNPAFTDTWQGFLNIDYLPEVSEMATVYKTDLARPGDTPVYVSSSYDASTVAKHFTWMTNYGIDGAFVERFPCAFINSTPSQIDAVQQGKFDQALLNAMTAAEASGVSFAVMYDLTGLPPGAMQLVIQDWQHLMAGITVNANGSVVTGPPVVGSSVVQVLQSKAYQQHNGKPVVGVFGIGFNAGGYPTLVDVQTLLSAPSPLISANYCIVAGVPSGWLRQTTTNMFSSESDAFEIDANPPPAPVPAPTTPYPPTLLQVLQLANIIMPWTPGRFTDLGRARLRAEQYLIPDLVWCKTNGLEYLPVVFPGFSNINQSARSNSKPAATAPREAGRFLWEQYRVAAEAGCDMIYQAMFDEMDEGTQIFKVAQTPPDGLNLLHYSAMQNGQEVSFGNQPLLPADYYLTLVGAAAALFHEQPIEQPFPSRIPALSFSSTEDPNGTWATAVNSYLRSTDPQVYQTAANSYSTNKAIASYLPLLARWNANHTPIGSILGTPVAIGTLSPGTTVQLFGTWPTRPISSTDPSAMIIWTLPIPALGTYELWIRTPGPSQNSYATNARLIVTPNSLTYADSYQFNPIVNLRLNTQTWQDMGAIVFGMNGGYTPQQAQFPILVSITLAANSGATQFPTGPLTFFEARLVPTAPSTAP